MTHAAALTPYLIPTALQGRKIVNLGDGFILRAIERLIGPFSPNKIFSTRERLSSAAQVLLTQSPSVVLAGANQLNDKYTVLPGCSAQQIRDSKITFVPFGIGLHGDPGHTDGFSQASKEVLLAVHEKLEFSSWRCPRTVAYLTDQLPELKSKALMTGCPVLYDKPLLEGKPFRSESSKIALTVTERGEFWDRETAMIDFVATQFKRSDRYLVLHQNYFPPVLFENFRYKFLAAMNPEMNVYQKLRRYAVKKGFKIVVPTSADNCIAFYQNMDMHFGSRLHAHLLFLSAAKKSWLVPVDGRAVGIAEHFKFPLCEPTSIGQELQFDFEIVRHNARICNAVMQRFVQTIPR
jgi:Polysaccharide pyruvyl transferase